MPDDLSRWAASRIPALIERAEAEAVEELKQALIAAAQGREQRKPASSPPPAPRRKPAVEGDALWCYCVARATDALPEDVEGVDESGRLRRVEAGGLAVLTSRVPLAEFGEEPLRENLNDFPWLEQVARRHEAVLEEALGGATIVPLRLCTIFEDEGGVKQMLVDQGPSLREALDALEGRQEWGAKLLVQPSALESAARERSAEARALQDELEARSGGGAYMLRRRLERHLRQEAERIGGELGDAVHAALSDCATDFVLNSPQNRELSGHDGDMLLNAAYLIEDDNVERLHALVAELEREHAGMGARLELSGPWPPYNFVPTRGATLT